MAAAQQPNQGGDNSSGILWTVAALFAGLFVLWHTGQYYIAKVYLSIKLFEINFLSYFTSGLDDARTVILGYQQDLHKVTPDQLMIIGKAVGDYLRYPCILLIMVLASTVYLTNITRVFKRIYSMKDLADAEQQNWPFIMPVTKFDLIKTDIDKGPWAMAMTPMQFCKKHKLLQEHKVVVTENSSRKDWGRIEVTLKRGEATKIFTMQLGPLWPGIERVPPHVKALFAIFAARYNTDTTNAINLLRQIAGSSQGKLNFNGMEELLAKHINTKGIQKIMHNHAYLLTVMGSMILAARDDGVQASADFLWLKPIDRRLWYMLNTIGRQTPFVEVAGPFAHWVAEREMGRKLLVPMVEEATNALELSLQEVIYKQDEAVVDAKG